MTAPEMAARPYTDPPPRQYLEEIIRQESELCGGRGFALLPTVGGQTALNVAVALAESGALERHGVKLIGASLEAIHRAEDRSGFKRAMLEAGPPGARAGSAPDPDAVRETWLEQVRAHLKGCGLDVPPGAAVTRLSPIAL